MGGFVIQIDNMFSENFPEEIKSTSKDLELRIGKDQNTFKKIYKRIKKAKKDGTPIPWQQSFFNILVNLWYYSINNFYIVIYYYFFPLMCLFIQFIMFYVQNTRQDEQKLKEMDSFCDLFTATTLPAFCNSS